MLRALPLMLALVASPALGWEFTPTPVCTLSHEGTEAAVKVTYDPRQPDPYAIALTLPGAVWPAGPVFTITFEGVRTLTIGTDRHRVSEDGAMLTVTDRGFGNVLDGLQFGGQAVVRLDGVTARVPLAGAAEPVDAFRACIVAPMS